MLALRRCPRGAFAGVVLSVRRVNNTTFLKITIPYEECTRRQLGDVYVCTKKILFCINSENEESFMDELEYIVTTKTNIPLDNVYFSSWFVNHYVRKKLWKVDQEKACGPTDEEIQEKERQKWLYTKKRR